MGHSPIDLHTHDMLVFFLNLVVGPELAPPVHVDFSLPVLYFLQVLYRGLEKDSFLHGELHPAGLPDQRDLSLCLHDAQRLRGKNHAWHLSYA